MSKILMALVSVSLMMFTVFAYAATMTVNIEPSKVESAAMPCGDSNAEVTCYCPFSAFD